MDSREYQNVWKNLEELNKCGSDMLGNLLSESTSESRALQSIISYELREGYFPLKPDPQPDDLALGTNLQTTPQPAGPFNRPPLVR